MNHKSKHRVFLLIIKIKYLNNFIKTNLVQYSSKPYFILDLRLRENTRREFIGTKNTEWQIAV